MNGSVSHRQGARRDNPDRPGLVLPAWTARLVTELGWKNNLVHWGSPTILFALWLVPVSGILLVYAHRRRQQSAAAFIDGSMRASLVPSVVGWQRWLQCVLVMTGTGLLIVSAARPQFGVIIERVSARGVDLMVLLDVSRSMLAEDVAPNRLERAKSDILDLLPRLQGDRVGLMAFAGAPRQLSPLTTDHAFFRMALQDADPDSAPRGGSLIGDAIRRALESLPQGADRDQVIVLITDGDDQESEPLLAAEQAAERGVRVITVGLGDNADGARIPTRQTDGSFGFTKHDGQEVWSKLDESLLQEIARNTSGAWVPAGTRAYDLGQVYDNSLAGLTRGEYQANHQRRYREQFQWFAVAGLLCLLGGPLVTRSRPLLPTT